MNAPYFNFSSGGDASAAPAGEPAMQVDSTQGAIADSARAQAGEAARRAAADSPRKRGRPRSDAANSSSDSRALQARVDQAVIAQLDALHDPDAWGALCALPGDAITAITGKESWTLNKDERKTLGITGSAFARTLMITNPKALAMMMFASAIFASYGTRALKEAQTWNAAKEAKKAEDAKQKT